MKLRLPSSFIPFASVVLLIACGDDTTSTGGGGVGAGPTTCNTAADCAANSCEDPVCNAGTCGTNPKPEGTDSTFSTPGDCQDEVCDGAGGTKLVPNDMDTPIPDDNCIVGLCTDGVGSFELAAVGSSCDGDRFCTKRGNCVTCIADANCVDTMICAADKGECAPVTCGNAMQDNDESDVDCGGVSCPACPDTSPCTNPDDCLSGVCAGTCQAPTCTDNVRNGNESDRDCGAMCPEKCNQGDDCFTNADCTTNKCVVGRCE